jgi:hypothetical protein
MSRPFVRAVLFAASLSLCRSDLGGPGGVATGLSWGDETTIALNKP